MKPLPRMPMERTRLTITRGASHDSRAKPQAGQRLDPAHGNSGNEGRQEHGRKACARRRAAGPVDSGEMGRSGEGRRVWRVHMEGHGPEARGVERRGNLRMRHVVLASIPFLDYVASAAPGTRNSRPMELEQCSMEFSWKYPRMEIRDIEIEADEAFRIVGNVTITTRKIDGTLSLGVRPENLDWLPKAGDDFPHAAKAGTCGRR